MKKMKILIYATPNGGGHHLQYFATLVNGLKNEYDVVAVLPEPCAQVKCRQVYISRINWGTRKLKEYLLLMNALRKIVAEEKPDIIHIQCGDNFYRFMGLGLKRLSCHKVVITFHHMRKSFLRKLSIKRIFKIIDRGIVHTEMLKSMLNNMGILNVEHVEYPCMLCYGQSLATPEDAKQHFKMSAEKPCLLAAGNTRHDKGLDILLKALQLVKTPFQLLIAGSESQITKRDIQILTSGYQENVFLKLEYLSDNELALAFKAADIIVLPYRKVFDGASGPLGEGTTTGKMIIGPNHGSLGDIIEKNHLGFTFETENVQSLALCIDRALKSEWRIDEVYLKYQKSLSPDSFVLSYRQIFSSE